MKAAETLLIDNHFSGIKKAALSNNQIINAF
jgi:hypothetical protein